MKYIYQFFIVLLCAFSFASCGDDDFIEIDSLCTDGDEFYCNQKVKVWMCVRSSDLWHTNYEWSCDAGSLTQPQGLNEMTWKAPSTPGTYTITCRASIGGESQVRSHKIILINLRKLLILYLYKVVQLEHLKKNLTVTNICKQR